MVNPECYVAHAGGAPVTRKPTALGLAALQPQPMGATAVIDLIARARVNGQRVLAEVTERAALARSETARANYRMTPCRIAAHLVRLSGCSMPDAARTISKLTRRTVSHSGVHQAFRSIYPNVAVFAKQSGLTLREWMQRNPQFPPGSTCACCAGPAVGALHREQLGRNGGLVNVCQRCATESAAGSNRHRVVNSAVRR